MKRSFKRYPAPEEGVARIAVLDGDESGAFWIECPEIKWGGYFATADDAIAFCESEVGYAWKVEVWTNGAWKEVANGK